MLNKFAHTIDMRGKERRKLPVSVKPLGLRRIRKDLFLGEAIVALIMIGPAISAAIERRKPKKNLWVQIARDARRHDRVPCPGGGTV